MKPLTSWFLIAVACKGCTSCYGDIPLPEQNDPEDNVDTAQEDTDTQEPEDTDTGPPLPCDFPEEEPNNDAGAANELPMEKKACGTLDSDADIEIFRVDFPVGGWLSLNVDGFTIGSHADLQMIVTDTSGEYTAISTTSTSGTDPYLLLPVPEGRTWLVTISDQAGLSGEDFIWEFRPSEDKVPVEWDGTETEPNNGYATGNLVTGHQMLWGTIDGDSDQDWFLVDVPAEGRTTVNVAVKAWSYGSPLDSNIQVWQPAEVEGEEPTFKRTYSTGTTDIYDLDPSFSYEPSSPGIWGFKLEPYFGDGPLAWYVLDIEVITEEIDTGAP
jgi:hypothetical protein